MESKVKEYITALDNMVYSEKKYEFAHCFTMSGWVLKQPQVKNGIEKKSDICFFIIYQIHRGYSKSFRCSTYNKELIKLLTEQKKVFALSCIGRINTTKNFQMMFLVSDAKLCYSIDDMPLLESESK